MADCTICVEKYNNVIRAEVVCTCKVSFCRNRVETYLKSTNDDNHCMNCKTLWDDEFMISNLSQATTKRLNEHRKDLLLAREKAKIPHTQKYYKYNNEIMDR